MNCLVITFNYSNPSNMLSRLSDARGKINEEQVYLINKTLTKLKTIVRNVPKDNPLKTEENEKIRYCWKDSWA